MAYGDFLQLQQATAARSRRDLGFAPDLTDVKNALNESYLMVCDDGTQWDFLEATGSFNTAAATSTYSFATIATGIGGGITVTDVLAMRQTAGGTMYGLDWNDFERIRGIIPALSEAPLVWTKTRDSEVVVYPTPSGISAIPVIARREPPALSGDTDVPLVPLSWRHRILVNYAAARLMQDESGDASEEAQALLAAWQVDMEAFREAHASTREPYPWRGPVHVPTGLRGVSGSLLDLAQRACYHAGLKWWNDYDLARAKEAVDEVYRHVCSSGDQWSFLEKELQFAVTANTAVYTYAAIATQAGLTGASIGEVLGVVNDTLGTWTLQPMDWRELEKVTLSTRDAGEVAGVPVAWAKWGGGDVAQTEPRVRFYPKPDLAYLFGMITRLRPAELTLDADVPVIPADYRRDVLVSGAAVRLLNQPRSDMQDPARLADLQEHKDRYDRAVGDMRSVYAAVREPTVTLMGAGYPYGGGDGFDVGWGDW